MSAHIRLGDVSITLIRKDIKHVHLAVHPPAGRVTMVAPTGTRTEVARAFAITKLGWIRQQQSRFRGQAREPRRHYIERETHVLWGRRHLLRVEYADAKPSVVADHRHITLTVRPDTNPERRAEIMHDRQRSLLHRVVPAMIELWEPRLRVKVKGYLLQRMKTKWGSCNSRVQHIRLNTELVKKPKDLLEYVIVREMLHILEPRHSERFSNSSNVTTLAGARLKRS